MNSTPTMGQVFRDTLTARRRARSLPVDTRSWESVPEEDKADLEAAVRDALAVMAPAELAAVTAERNRLAEFARRLERVTTAWTRGMYAARIDCVRGDVKAAIECLSEGLDGYDGTEWNGAETGAEWWERTKAAEGL